MRYSKKIVEYIKLKCESTRNNTAIAREMIKDFDLPISLETARKKISAVRIKLKEQGFKRNIKRLFFDIETSYITARVWRTGKQWVDASNITSEKKIICVCYKWQFEDYVHTLTWDKEQDDKKLLKDLIKVLSKADEIIAHNGDRFDLKELRTRCIVQGVPMFPKYRTLDTLKKARKYFNFHSNRLNYLGQVLEVGRKLDHEGIDMWRDIQEKKSKKALKKMVDYCTQDVVLLEDVFNVLMPYIDHNINFSVLKGGPKWACPECASEKVKLSHTDTTPMGYVKRHMKCKCKKVYHISNKSYQAFLTQRF